MKLNVLAAATAALVVFAGPSMAASTGADISDTVLDGKVTGLPGVTVSPTGFVGSWLVTGTEIPSPQNAASIQAFLEGFAPAGLGPLTLQDQLDDAGGGQTAALSLLNGGANVFAVHLGQGEMIFTYSALVNLFEIQVPDGNVRNGGWGGLSNIRAFLDPALLSGGSGGTGGNGNSASTPIPAAAWFLLSAIGGLGAMGRMRSKMAKS